MEKDCSRRIEWAAALGTHIMPPLDTMLQGLVSALSCFGPPSLFILLPVLSFGVEILVPWHSVLEEYNCFLFILFLIFV